MTTVSATIGSDIQIPTKSIPAGALEEIKRYLTVPNKQKAKALARGDYGAKDMDDAFWLWEDDLLGTLVVPRGVAKVLVNGLAGHGVDVGWRDLTSRVPMSLLERVSMEIPTMRPNQERAIQIILAERQGIVQADPGVGKTVMGLEAARRYGQNTLVLVEKGHLVRQWKDRAREHLGIEVGMIGDGIWEERSITVATMQTLYRRLRELRASRWFERWGATLADEVHHCVADTYREVIMSVCSSLFIGFTATPLDDDWLQKLLVSVVGPVIHRVDDDTTLSPTIVAVPTGFEWQMTKAEEKLKDPRAIYRHLLKALEQDHGRVRRIVQTIASQPESTAQLVLSKRIEYLDLIGAGLIVEAGWSDERIMTYQGKDKLDARDEVVARASEGSCVILSTLADEGLDIPRLDRLHLTWPARKELTITQQVGRVARAHEGKLSPVVFDYVDTGHPMFYDQFKARRRLYNKKGWNIEIKEARSA